MTVNDPENYAKMSIPFENEEKANESLRLFYEEVSASRKKNNISDVLIVVKDSAINPSGEIGVFMADLYCGNGLNKEAISAWAYGQSVAERKELIGKYLAGTGK